MPDLDPVRPDPDAAAVRTSCSLRLVQGLGAQLGLKPDTNPDVVLKEATEVCWKYKELQK